eukprot:4645540-Alexandrium_andersonii.AAC.1
MKRRGRSLPKRSTAMGKRSCSQEAPWRREPGALTGVAGGSDCRSRPPTAGGTQARSRQAT